MRQGGRADAMKESLPYKQHLLDAAEVTDAWRVVPRVMVAGYGYLVWEVTAWFQALPSPSDPQQWFLNVIWGAAAAVAKFYFDSGRNWRQETLK